jgi:hypothetical protein
MAEEESEKPAAYNVWGLQPFDEARVEHFLVEVLGRREKLPLKLDLNERGQEMELRIRARYDAANLHDCARLFTHQLESSDEDQEIWGSWRAEYA